MNENDQQELKMLQQLWDDQVKIIHDLGNQLELEQRILVSYDQRMREIEYRQIRMDF